jgi:glycosyltransferase involved in cell wall biosynthesis
MDIFVLSSISEGLPVAIAEAMAAHIPVVATSVGGLPEVVKDGYNGYLVPPGDANLLADRILTLIDDREKRGRLADNAKKVADEKLSLTAMIEAYQELYCELTRC